MAKKKCPNEASSVIKTYGPWRIGGGEFSTKFVRQQGGEGPSCYPGSPGAAEKKWCIEKTVGGWEVEINQSIEDTMSSIPASEIPSRGLLGDEFEKKVRTTSGGGTSDNANAYGVVINELDKMHQTKEDYNKHLKDNMSEKEQKSGDEEKKGDPGDSNGEKGDDDGDGDGSDKTSDGNPIGLKGGDSNKSSESGTGSNGSKGKIPATVLQMDRYEEETVARMSSFSGAVERISTFEITECYCAEALQDQCKKLTLKSNKAEEDCDSVDDDDDVGSAPDNITADGDDSLSRIFGQYKVLSKLIERRNDTLIFSVALYDPSLVLNRIWFESTLVFENGKILKPELLSDVYTNPHEYKDLFTITLEGANLSEIMFLYNGQVWVEAIQSPVQDDTVVYEENNSQILFVDPPTGFIAATQGAEGVYVYGHDALPGSTFAAQVMRFPDSFYNPFDSHVYWKDKKVNPYSGGVETLTFSIDAPLGVTAEGALISNTHYVLGDKRYSFSYPFADAAHFVDNVGVSADGHTLYEMDIDNKLVVPYNMPETLSYDSLLFHKRTKTLVMLSVATGTAHILNLNTFEWEDSVTYGSAVVEMYNSNIPDSGIITMIDVSTNEQIHFNIFNKEFIVTPIVIPHTFVKYALINDILAGVLSGGNDLMLEKSGWRSTGTLRGMVEAIEPSWTSLDVPITGYLMTGDSSYLTFLNNIAKAYNVFAFNEGGIGSLLYASSDNDEPIQLVSSFSDNMKDGFDNDEDEADTTVSFEAKSTAYEDIKVEVQAPAGISESFKTTAIMSEETLNERVKQLIGRTVLDDTKDIEAALSKNIEHIPGKNTLSSELDLESHSTRVETSNIIGEDTTYTRESFPVSYVNEGKAPASVLPGAYTLFDQKNREIVCEGHVIGHAVNTLPHDLPYKLIQACKGPELYVDFLSVPVIGASVTYEELIEDPFLNLVCVRDEWIQYQFIEWVTPTRAKLFGLMRGRFLTFGKREHSAGEAVHFYTDAACQVTKDNRAAAKPDQLPPYINRIEYRFSKDTSGTPFSFFWSSKDAVDVDFNYDFNLQKIKVFIEMKKYGIKDIRDVLEEIRYADEYKVWVNLKYRDDFTANPYYSQAVTDALDAPTPPDSEVHDFFLHRGTNKSYGRYRVQERRFNGVRLWYTTYDGQKNFTLKWYVDGVEGERSPVVGNRVIDVLVDFNPYKQEFTYGTIYKV